MAQDRFSFVPYTLSRLFLEDDTSEYGCICPNFISPELEFIPAYYVCDVAQKRNDVSYKEQFIQVCAAFGLNQRHVSDFMDYMALTDYAITNYDRHFNNFGVIRDTHTMKLIDVAPIFDSGNSMFWNRPMPKTKYDLLNAVIFNEKQQSLE